MLQTSRSGSLGRDRLNFQAYFPRGEAKWAPAPDTIRFRAIGLRQQGLALIEVQQYR
jgi:hypothetical protein